MKFNVVTTSTKKHTVEIVPFEGKTTTFYGVCVDGVEVTRKTAFCSKIMAILHIFNLGLYNEEIASIYSHTYKESTLYKIREA